MAKCQTGHKTSKYTPYFYTEDKAGSLDFFKDFFNASPEFLSAKGFCTRIKKITDPAIIAMFDQWVFEHNTNIVFERGLKDAFDINDYM